MDFPSPVASPTTYHLEASCLASENPLWRDVVSDVYRKAYGKRGLDVHGILPCERHLQPESVDYQVTLADYETGDGFQSWCELKTERHCFGRITVEEWSVYEAGITGWPWKLTGINHQRLCTVWRDGLVFFPYLDDYKCWLWDFRETLLNKVASGHPDYKRITSKNIGYGKGYTSYAFTLPITDLRDAFGTKPFYQLEGIALTLAQQGIDEITQANKGSPTGLSPLAGGAKK